ncbi:MAG: DUF952 domain-containing protein [Bacteroidota bacterium]
MSRIYHLVKPRDWEKSLDKGIHTPPSLKTEGFIHCSAREQVIPSAEKHFQDIDELVILEIVEKRVKDRLKWEPSRDGALFPHLYGKLDLHEVENTHILFKQGADWVWDQ